MLIGSKDQLGYGIIVNSEAPCIGFPVDKVEVSRANIDHRIRHFENVLIQCVQQWLRIGGKGWTIDEASNETFKLNDGTVVLPPKIPETVSSVFAKRFIGVVKEHE